jgi:hypothetical protein
MMVKWLSTLQLAAALGVTPRSARRIALRSGWLTADREFPANPSGTWRKRKGRGGGGEVRADLVSGFKLADISVDDETFLQIAAGRVLVEGAT